MSEILQANIFFIITSIAVLVFTVFVCVILYHVIKIVRTIRKILERIDEGSELIADEMSQLRTYVMEGSLVSQILGFFVKRKTVRARPKKPSKDITND